MSGLDTCSADQHLFSRSFVKRFDSLKIGFETPFVDVVGVAHVVAYPGPFAANFANSRHVRFLLIFFVNPV